MHRRSILDGHTMVPSEMSGTEALPGMSLRLLIL